MVPEFWGNGAGFPATTAPRRSPNVLVVLFDDTGRAAWSPYGGRVNMPTLDRLARDGLTYTQWHTAASGPATRSCFLTGRRHPGGAGPNATLATVLRDAGWSTFWVGKNDTVPVDEQSMGATRRHWPLAQGFDRFYGFLGGETNQWYPSLVSDHHATGQPYPPEDGYHLSRDLADKALEFIRDVAQTAPGRPWYLWWCPGANHAPHHAPYDYIEKYRGAFDDGYEAYREWVLPRMIERRVLPTGTVLTPMRPPTPGPHDAVRPWSGLTGDERRLSARMAEVFAAFSEFTDAQVGRVIDYLEESGQLDNTLIIYAAAAGASGEGGPDGSVNEARLRGGHPDAIEDTVEMIDKLGGPETYNHYPTGWAAAFSTPHGTAAPGAAGPLVVCWPAGIASRGEVRHQYHHATDIVPTILDCCGLTRPEPDGGAARTPLTGVSMRYSFDDPDAATTRPARHDDAPVTPTPSFTAPPPGRYTYYPGTGEIPERFAANTHGVSYTVRADVELTPDSEGVIFAHGSRFGGHALYIKDHRLVYVYNFLGLPPEQILADDAPLSGRHILGVDFTKQYPGERYESYGPARLHVDDLTLAEAEIRTMTGPFSPYGEGLCIGYDAGDAVTAAYRPRFPFAHGRIVTVVFEVGEPVPEVRWADAAAPLSGSGPSRRPPPR